MKKRVIVNDKMQRGYVYYLKEKEGENFENDFEPELTPKEMLELGVFGGIYMRDCKGEFPSSWFFDARFAKGNKRDKDVNFFRVNASSPLNEWRRKRWINEKEDPRGWFQWYCRYYMGRRIGEYDGWQIKRWKNMRRHVAQVKKYCQRGDLACRRRQRQALLHWAYDSRKL